MPDQTMAQGANESLLTRLGRLLGVRTDEVEAVLRHDEARARSTVQLQRRGFLGAAAALAAAPFVPKAFVAPTSWSAEFLEWEAIYVQGTIHVQGKWTRLGAASWNARSFWVLDGGP